MEKLNILKIWDIISQRQGFIMVDIDTIIPNYGPFRQFGSYYENIYDTENQQVQDNKSLLLVYSLIFDNNNENTLFKDNSRTLRFIEGLDIDTSLESKRSEIVEYINSIRYYNTFI